MRTSAIAYRVADFLAKRPPFQFFDAATVLEIARSGRVKFHESDEYVFQQGAPRYSHIFVIQQGRVELILEDGAGGETLHDVLGEGDTLGLGAFRPDYEADAPYTTAARTAGDVVLYALDSALFGKALRESPRAMRYIRTYFSVISPEPGERGAALEIEGERWWPGESARVAELAARNSLVLDPDAPVREIARALLDRDDPAVMLGKRLDDGRTMVDGVATPLDLCRWIASGEVSGDTPGRSLLAGPPVSVARGATAGEVALALLASRGRPVLLGAPDDCAGVLTARDLAVATGKDPLALAREIRAARDVDQLAALTRQCRDWLVGELEDVAHTRWLASVSTELCRTLFERTLALARPEAPLGLPGECWLLLGPAARGEILDWRGFDFAVIHEADDEASRRRYQELSQDIETRLEACGVRLSSSRAAQRRTGSREDWRRYYEGLVENPILNSIYKLQSSLDFTYSMGDAALAAELREGFAAAVAANDGFVALLANDSMANWPPLTFYDGLVMEDGGTLHDTLDLRRAAIFPLIDAARVVGLAAGSLAASSAERYEAAAVAYPGHAQLFAEAADALRIALYYQARANFRDEEDGTLVYSLNLSKIDQQQLKNVFRLVIRLLDRIDARFGVKNLV